MLSPKGGVDASAIICFCRIKELSDLLTLHKRNGIPGKHYLTTKFVLSAHPCKIYISKSHIRWCTIHVRKYFHNVLQLPLMDVKH
ncbi:hypothetical protein CICLE_v10017343mg [Citrus x clementina]|uniref:Uncharacterized protein n=1 Tax=Citrus clementina TaxID=85681 RepID=V4TML3_CITCL|nr:hypothetical protein CICLE_v10017343mg [Citrus x clementina]